MATTHLFPIKQPQFAVGQRLFAPAGTALTFKAYDFVPNFNNTARVNSVNWDFGDGSLNLVDGLTSGSDASHTYAEPGVYIVTCQVLYGYNLSAPAEVAQSGQTSQREVEVFLTRAQTTGNTTVPWVALLRDSFQDEATGQVQHALVILPLLSSVVTGSAVGAAS